MMLSTQLLFSFILFLFLLYKWILHHYSYWKRKNIPHIKPNLLVGNLKDITFLKLCPAECLQNLYHHKISETQPFIGIYLFHKPGLLIREPELIKRILIKDFNKFSNRYSRADPYHDKLGAFNVFFLKNPEWKLMRSKLSPTFTSGKMKQMFSLVNDVGKQLDKYLCDLSQFSNKDNNPICIECKDTCALYTTDVIASTAFGIEANSIKNPNGEFRTQGKKLFDFTIRRALQLLPVFFLPQLVFLFKSKIFTKEAENFLRSLIDHVMKERIRTGTSRNDLIDVLITLKNSSFESPDGNQIRFEGDVLVSQAALFFTAGFETSSSTMSFCLFEISKRPEIQKRLRQEIKDTLTANDGDITYESIQNMEYLNMVVQEILRLYPPLPFLDRECTLSKDEDGYSLEPFSDYKIPHGMPVYIPIYAIQRDPKYFPDPNNFDPERFAPGNKDSIQTSTYLPFGTGPHNCIGERFGIMQTKIGLIYFLKNHYVRLSSKTPSKMKLDRKSLITRSENGIHCEIFKDSLL